MTFLLYDLKNRGEKKSEYKSKIALEMPETPVLQFQKNNAVLSFAHILARLTTPPSPTEP
ncbi:MAG: hypothetical protein EAZ24_00960 [Burkholderiales bacterium]|nr:MAG: hypothetical protein EAZ21_11080 [Betaproteobacteria bacterium]TAG84597.1 MAG: hypothetical protein EAZ24_00960 [Burkholderiales bacterium]